jgi:hypothetical protein
MREINSGVTVATVAYVGTDFANRGSNAADVVGVVFDNL